jgi:hypothetical protein
MCCNTHPLRDRLALAEVDPGDESALQAHRALMAPSDDWRCRCGHQGTRCERKADAEDLLCAWCRETDHPDWWAANVNRASAASEWLPETWRYAAGGYVDEAASFSPAYSEDFYQAGRVGGFLSEFEAATLPFEFNYDHLKRGLAQAMAADLPPATPAMAARLFGLPKL